MESPGATTVDPASAAPADSWHALPARGAVLAAIGAGLGLAIPLTAVGTTSLTVAVGLSPWLLAPAIFVGVGAVSAWMVWRRHRRLRWRLDATGLAVQRGNWWRSETHVPLSRVQHLDLKRGPLERSLGLCTLIVHTAGSRQATVSVPGLDASDGEQLRDRLANQLDLDDALA